jgi:hypothetical protein
MMHAQAEVAEQQVVVLSQVLANEVNIGYEEILNTQVLQLNGKRILNMKDLVAAVDSCKEEYLHFDLDYNQKVGGWVGGWVGGCVGGWVGAWVGGCVRARWVGGWVGAGWGGRAEACFAGGVVHVLALAEVQGQVVRHVSPVRL